MVVTHENAHLDLLHRMRVRVAILSNLELYEDVPWNKIDTYFSNARVFVNTSTHEGFPNTFVQAALSARLWCLCEWILTRSLQNNSSAFVPERLSNDW